MYGLVNRAVQELVVSQFGKDKWDAIKKKAATGVQTFVSMQNYPDETTYKLVAAASEVLEVPPEKVLEAFGEYWITYTAANGYGDMFQMFGSSMAEFLSNLDNLHVRVGMTFPKLRPPSVRCTEVNAEGMRVHYYSERVGLAPLMVGLLRGLGKRFGTEVDVAHAQDEARADEADREQRHQEDGHRDPRQHHVPGDEEGDDEHEHLD